VIFNLLINAMDSIEEGASGKAEREVEKQIWIDGYYEPCQVRILIEDSGPGIPEDLGERIFEPFVSTKQHGTGLGLAVSYGIMERHQGTLKITPPRHGRGACFEIVLPLEIEGENGTDFDCR
jgi:signal transduction histidine kinase